MRNRRITIFAAILLLGFGPASMLAEPQRSAVPRSPDDRVIIHVLNRIAFGPAPGDVERVKRVGLESFIEQQLHPERLSDERMAERLSGFATLGKSTRELAGDYFLPALQERRARQRERAAQDPAMEPGAADPEMRGPQSEAVRAERTVLAELAQQKVLRAIYSERQLHEVMVEFWFNHFNVFAGKGPTRMYLTEYERDTIRPRVFGRFRDLLGAVAESPAMLFYLDNWQSAAPGGAQPARGRPGARRGMSGRAAAVAPQVRRTRGLNENYARELMELHTLGVDGGYTQKDVQAVARAFTGWTIDAPRQGGGFRFEPRMHDTRAKMVLGRRIDAGGRMDGEQVLDLLARHPSTARFIATKLARRFVADDPPASLVSRAAARFRETDGDIREVVRTIVTSREFFAPAAYRAKVKTPLEFVASAARAKGAQIASAQPIVAALRELGMPLYGCQPPTGYADRADAWVNTGALLNRMNFAIALTSGRGQGARPSRAIARGGAPATRDTLLRDAFAGEVSEATAATVAKATTPAQALALLLGSPEFQKR